MRKPYHTGNSPRFTWQLGENGGELRDFPVTPLMTANDMSALNGALVCGEGLLLTGDVMAKPFVESGMVRRVLAGWTGPEVDFNAVFAGGRLVSPKVRAFVDFLVEAQLRRQLHAGAVPGREAGTAAEGAGRRRAGKQRQADPGEGCRLGGMMMPL
jgi:DNA-binding transcriptional LysR family regulator